MKAKTISTNAFNKPLFEKDLDYAYHTKKYVYDIKQHFGKNLNNAIYVTLYRYLLDLSLHSKKSHENRRSTLWLVSTYFNEEFLVAQTIIHDLNKHVHCLNTYHSSEIALLIIASKFHLSPSQIYIMIDIISEITKIVKYYFMYPMDIHSPTTHSFLEHIKLLSYRIVINKYDNSNIVDMLDVFKAKYILAFQGSEKVASFIQKKYRFTLTKTEKTFLAIHIQTMIYKSEHQKTDF
ncbi:beta-glucoside operon transcriptional antiterminator [Breznakia sp. PF5-3]|uniref:PRD domain-containing protein n=1 Tax=unclassified Breznakia TaxID=2623764 RepID=UPI0024064388|nr:MULTISPECIES: PRD domain-containing protein [unclassified Breznakia]MDF9824150.1 beta-glucoside operon transcriptional antiterminator [Breznakia sp. PM6-1]MDF9834948.1 beta-glucoside operon transcriptional antiterminator [Breznakia sp. PF5-3]MDF9837183.1 beta-glucoside operon transcriptional antiterminator [Breznakia sp. PFB2-8]MDF9859173.1 beta-glucoside operon transcriptional antiterminator [Breznakia sp. PH5-24]